MSDIRHSRLNGGSADDAARAGLKPSDFIVASGSLKGRLREAGIDERHLEKTAEAALSDMARRFAPTPPAAEDETDDSDAVSAAPPAIRPEPQLRRVPIIDDRHDDTPRAGMSPWMMVALVIACATPSAFGAFMLWNGNLPAPFAAAPAEPLQSEPAPQPVQQVVEAPPPAAEPLAPKSQDRMEAAVSAASDPLTKSTVQNKTALVAPEAPAENAAPAASPQISIAPVAAAAAAAQTELAISVDPASALEAGSQIAITGLPERAVLSAGQASSDGWKLTPDELAGLKLTLPQDAAGETPLKIVLQSEGGEPLAEAETTLRITPSPISRPDYVSRISSLMENGQKMIDVGYVSGARAYYIRAAEAGSPEGAMAAAATFDPNALAALQAHGVFPDVAQARHWYERAKVLGAGDADAKLAALPAR